jgi:hypothetical protein
MDRLVRGWLAFAAIGAGVIHLAIVTAAPLALGIVIGVLGTAEICWGVQTLVVDKLPLKRTARLATLAPVLVWGLVVVVESIFGTTTVAALPPIPMAIASVFDLALASGLSVLLRRERAEESASPSAGGWRYSIGLLVGGIVVSLLITPALALIPDAPPGAPPVINIHGH